MTTIMRVETGSSGMSNSGTAPQRLLIVDDHPVFRHGIRQLLGDLPDVAVCGEADNARAALQSMRELDPTIVLVDICMPGVNGLVPRL